MRELREALVLKWDSQNAWIRCPFHCDEKIHMHGFTMPKKDTIVSRSSHCYFEAETDGVKRSRYYRLVFPFEDEQVTNGFWWMLDRTRRCWRTIAWGVDDPDDSVQTPSEDKSSHNEDNDSDATSAGLHNTSDEKETDQGDLESAFAGLSIGQLQNQEKLLFDSYCVNNDVEIAQRILQRSPNARALVEEFAYPGAKPVLLAACEEGHIEMVEFLLSQHPILEAKDRDGNTALLSALHRGYGQIACRLLLAGASVDVRDRSRWSIQEVAREALREHLSFNKLELKYDDAEYPAIQTRRDKRTREISALQDIIEQCEDREAREFAERERKKLFELYGKQQAEHFITDNGITREGIISEMFRRICATPLRHAWKTVGCLTRGTALPYTIAVSGYALGLCDGALDRPLWTERVFKLASLLGHDFPVDSRDEPGRPGSFNACHAEKQLLAFALWTHSTALGDLDIPEKLGVCEAPSLSKLPMEIFVRQPAKKVSYICDDCASFCSKVASRFNMTLRLFVVDKDNPQLRHSWTPQ